MPGPFHQDQAIPATPPLLATQDSGLSAWGRGSGKPPAVDVSDQRGGGGDARIKNVVNRSKKKKKLNEAPDVVYVNNLSPWNTSMDDSVWSETH